MKNKILIILIIAILVTITSFYKPSKVYAEETIASNCFVDIKGSIINPGVYEIECNKRIIDVISLAGGLSEDADTSILNLSKKVKDEMYIIVYTNNQIKEYKEKMLPSKEIIKKIEEKIICPDTSNNACLKDSNTNTKDIVVEGKININTASKEELMTLPGIGESKADKIIEYRNNNRFNSIEDIKNISGIGESIFNKIKDSIKAE